MPTLWNETVETHRREVRDAIVDTTAALVQEHGLLSVTMSQIAEQTGIGRATLYKYFADVEAILLAWHERQIGTHLAQLLKVRDGSGSAADRLDAVLEAYAVISRGSRGHHDSDLAAFLHGRENRVHLARAEQEVRELVEGILGEAAAGGAIRNDVPVEELATYCLQALDGARNLSSVAAVQRLVTVTLAGLRPQD